MAEVENNYLTLHVPNLASRVLDILHDMRKHALCVDTVVCVQDEEFTCHRVVLSACSSFFKAMFSHELRETVEARVTLNDVRPEIMKDLIEFAYTAKLHIHEENIQEMLTTSIYLQFDDVTTACCDFLTRHLTSSNCLEMWKLAENHACESLRANAQMFSLWNFCEVKEQEEFLKLDKDFLIRYIRDDELQCDDEVDVCQAVIQWSLYEKSRFTELTSILEHVRLPLANLKAVMSHSPPELMADKQFKEFLDEAINCQFLIQQGYRVQGPRTRMRGIGKNSGYLVALGGQVRDGDGIMDATFNGNSKHCAVSSVGNKKGPWQNLASIPNHRKRKYSLVNSGTDIYILGGYDSVKQRSTAEVWRYNFTNNYWTQMSNLTIARHSHGSTEYNGCIYVAGGKNSLLSMRLNSVEKYNIETDEWVTVPSMPEAVSVPAAVASCGRVYVLGGSNVNNMPCHKIQCLSLNTLTWSVVRHITIQRKLLSAAVLGDTLYIFGGKSARDVIIYNPKSESLRYELHACNEQRLYPGVLTWRGKIYLTGGKGTERVYNDADVYDTETNEWSRIDAFLPKNMYMHGCFLIEEH
ncbi:kelch-like protein 24 [Saccoglossus kowalevskii]|uniref:Kelch-like protein 24-like n=1 Tax=Saccoglossus kowalevskii TaxID=10224 RepID=A0ABM0GRC9_SACKO|nr:PREDICTED: kelch-like protein 24-like [Saccoglossus kowalevskii]